MVCLRSPQAGCSVLRVELLFPESPLTSVKNRLLVEGLPLAIDFPFAVLHQANVTLPLLLETPGNRNAAALSFFFFPAPP